MGAIFKPFASRDIFMAATPNEEKTIEDRERQRLRQGNCRCLRSVIFSQKNSSRNAGVCLLFVLIEFGDRKARRNLSENINWQGLVSFRVRLSRKMLPFRILNNFNELSEGKGERDK